MKKGILNKQKWNGLGILIFVLCLCLMPADKVMAAHETYSITENTYDTQIIMSPGDTCVLSGNDNSVSYYEFYGTDETVATVDLSSGYIAAVNTGVTYIMILGYDEYGDMIYYAEACINVVYSEDNNNNWNDTTNNGTTDGSYDNNDDYYEEVVVPVDMTGVTLDKTSVKVKANRNGYDGWYYYSSTVQLNLNNTPEPVSEWMDSVDFQYTSSNQEMRVYCSLYDNIITVDISGTGTTSLEFTINGEVFTCEVKVVPVYINSSSIVLSKGDTKQLKVKNGGSDVTWESQDKKIATVNSKGIVKAKKTGTTVIIATIGDQKYGCAVNVTSASMKKVVNNATSIAKGTYSQEKRMQKGYYDCSSLVWRSYSPIGVKFGNNNWAPVAADIGKWCAKNGKKVSNSLTDAQIQKKKLQVGDLLFQTGSDNGRYKGIYHVELFIGYACTGVDSNGEAYLTTRCPARGDGYGYGTLVLRPKK